MARYAIDPPTLLRLVRGGTECRTDHQLVAPNVNRTAAMSLLLAAVARGEMTERAALEQHERMTALKIRLLGDRVSRRTAWKLARLHGWDDLGMAEYIAVCSLQADALVTIDPVMIERAAGIVPLAPLPTLLDS